MENIIKCENGIIYKFNISYKGPIKIPEKCSDDSIIITINQSAGKNSLFTSIDMSGTKIETICKESFLGSKYLTEVKFSPTLKALYENSFCSTPIESVSFPNTLTCVYGAFNRCSYLNTITMAQGSSTFVSESNCLFSYNFSILYMVGSNLRFKDIPRTDKIEKIYLYCFSQRKIEKFIASSNLKELYLCAFHAANNMKVCNLSLSNVAVLPYHCFWDMASLEKIILPRSLIKIENKAIQVCPKLRFIVIPESVSSIEASAIVDLSKLTDVYFYGATFINNDAFNGYSVKVHVTTFYKNSTFAKLPVTFDASNALNEVRCPRLTLQRRARCNNSFLFVFIMHFIC